MILFRIALRNLASHKLKSFIVGGLLAFGTFLLMVGQALLGSLDQSMARSVTGSLSGQLQAYSTGAKDKLALFGDMNGGSDIGTINNFKQIRQLLEAQPEVQAVVPQGMDVAMVYGGNIIDVKLEALRAAEKTGDRARSQVVRAHIRRIIALLAQDMAKIGEVTDLAHASTETRQSLADLQNCGADTFWQNFDRDPLAAMEFLENKIAPLALNADMLFFRYMGTDTARFAKEFELFEIVDGTAIPPGQRGFLFNKLNYEDMVKHKTARRLDKMKDRLADGYKIAADDDLKAWIKLNKDQYKDVSYQLDDVAAAQVRGALQQALASKEENLDKLISQFMDMDDQNFSTRYETFYKSVAPHLMLYSVKVGDIMTIKSFTSSGYPTSVNVKIYGTFRFRSLDKSTLAGGVNVMDLMTYRDLYGFLSADKKQEIDALEKASGVKEIKREDAEAELFGGGAGEEVVEVGTVTPTDQAGAVTAAEALAGDPSPAAQAPVGLAVSPSPSAPSVASGGPSSAQSKSKTRRWSDDIANRVYSQDEIDSGVVRHMAIILKKGTDERKALAHLQSVADAAGLKITVVDWRVASGFIGDFLWVIYTVLATALLIIFIVAVIVMNNSMVMATLERTKEIGTMRAIGAQKTMILQMFLAEAVVTAGVFGGLGALLAVALVARLHAVGLPAMNDVLVFLFAGPRLYPVISPMHFLISGMLVALVALISTLYPAWLAMRVTPLEAMQDAE